jgi:hypothetical protein
MNQETYGGVSTRRVLRTHFILKFVNLILGLLFQVMIVKILATNEFATYAILLAVAIAGERALSFGIDRTILRFFPMYLLRGDVSRLVLLGKRLALIRLGSLVVSILTLLIVSQFADSLFPIAVHAPTLIAFWFWFVGYTLYSDFDAVAQSLVVHSDSTTIATAEIAVRFVATAVLSFYVPHASVDSIVAIYAFSMTVAALSLAFWILRMIIRRHVSSPRHVRAPTGQTFDLHQAIMFAAANYASTISWLISSPATIRIVAASGLNVVALAAFSFAQGLYISLQRALPGLLILPGLEAIIMAQASSGQRKEKIYLTFSVIFKAELVCVLAALIATTISGRDIIELLSRPEYAAYSYVLAFLMLNLLFGTAYRVLEIIAIMNFRQQIFFVLWPLGFLSTLTIYFTIGFGGIWSVLVLPLIDNLVRIGTLLFAFRRQEAWRALDPWPSIFLSLCTGVIITALVAAERIVPLYFNHEDVLVAAIGVGILLLLLPVLRPFRATELEPLLMSIPASWRFAKRVVLATTRA